MTPEERASIVTEKLAKFITVPVDSSQGTDLIVQALRDARNEAIEDAAKVADDMAMRFDEQFDTPFTAATDIAGYIRNLKTDPSP